MDGFKNNTKMQCFKEGGAVKYESRKENKKEMSEDMAQDKKVVKKAFAMHDKQEHKGEKTDLSKLKKGGRAKKSIGTVKKFNKGGSVTNVYKAKKSSGDKDNIKKTKLIKPAKAAAPSGAGGPSAFKKGGKVAKKMQAGGSVTDKERSIVNKLTGPSAAGSAAKAPSAASGQISDYERNLASNISKLDPAQQAEFAKQQAEATAKFNKKKGGKVKKYAEGGAVMSDEEKNWLGGADATDPFIQARMRSALGPKKPQGSYIPNADPTMDNRDVGASVASAHPNPSMIEDESQRGNISPNAAAFNKDIPGAGPVAAAPSAPVRPMRRPAPRPPVIEDEGNRGIVTPAQKEFNKSIPGSGSAPYIDIPANNPGMRQFRTDAVSPIESAWNWLSKSRSQRNKKPVA